MPTLDAALLAAPTLAVVAGPAPHHRSARGAAAGLGCRRADREAVGGHVGRWVLRDDRGGRASGLVGYHLRCSETVARALRTLLGRAAIGDVAGFRPPSRPAPRAMASRCRSELQRGVSARREFGGGVLLELSHEFDALRLVLGPVATAARERPHRRCADRRHRRDGGGRRGDVGERHRWHGPPGHGQRTGLRNWVVRGSAGELHADLLAGTIELRTPEDHSWCTRADQMNVWPPNERGSKT